MLIKESKINIDLLTKMGQKLNLDHEQDKCYQTPIYILNAWDTAVKEIRKYQLKNWWNIKKEFDTVANQVWLNIFSLFWVNLCIHKNF